MALQKLNTDVVHGVSSGNLDVDAIALDNRDVQSALGGALGTGMHWTYPSSVPPSHERHLVMQISHVDSIDCPCAM